MPRKSQKVAQVKTAESGIRRRSTRVSSTIKSSYFEDLNDVLDDSEENETPPRKATKTAANASRSRRRSQSILSDDDDQYEANDPDDEENGDSEIPDSEDEFATPPLLKPLGTAKRRRGPSAKSPRAKAQTAKSRPNSLSKVKSKNAGEKREKPARRVQKPPSLARGKGVQSGDDNESDDSDDDDDEIRVTVTPLPKLRDTNGIEYENTKLHPNTLLFLRDLKANNNRNWLTSHNPEYRRSQKDWESFVETMTGKIIEVDYTIPELPVKDVVFRIYRDIRFTNDRTPYKAHYSAAWSRTGRKGSYACYYVHVEPGHCLVGGGMWHPEAFALAKLRASIDERPHRIRRVLTDPAFVRAFLPDVVGKKEGVILKAFADQNRENALKTKPKGFHAEHRDIELLKLRNFTIGRQIPDEYFRASDAQEKIVEIIRPMVQFITFLNRVVMPDPGEDSDSDGNDNGGHDEGQGADDGDSDT